MESQPVSHSVMVLIQEVISSLSNSHGKKNHKKSMFVVANTIKLQVDLSVMGLIKRKYSNGDQNHIEVSEKFQKITYIKSSIKGGWL